jgi:hypothetical protein
MQTYTRVFCAVAIALCAAPIAAMAADPRPCELFSPKEIASVLGVTPERGQPSGPKVVKKDDVAATQWGCQWSVGERYFFVVEVSRFGSAADATRELTSVMQSLISDPDDNLPKLSEVPGPGEQNFWESKSGDDLNSATWISRKGQTVLGIVAVRMDVKRHEIRREQLRDLAASGLKRIP